MKFFRVAIGVVFALLVTAATYAREIPRAANPVQVEIFENVPAVSQLNPNGEPTEKYTEPAFAFVHIPTKYSGNALPLDRSTPFILRASLERSFAAGEHQFRLRARGAAWFQIDGKTLLSTKPQKPNRSGDDPVPPPVVRNSRLRPAPYPHQDAVAVTNLDGRPHRFTLIAVIGGTGLVPSPGELCVGVGPVGQVEQLLGPDTAPHLTDDEWNSYSADSLRRHKAVDALRRRSAGSAAAMAWNARHEKIRQWVLAQPAPKIADVSSAMPVLNEIDRFVGARLEKAGAKPAPLTNDLEFLRRLSLDTTGVIPTAAEIRAYLADSPASRRARAIDRLLASPAWSDHWVSYWQDVLAENPGILKPDLNNTGPFRWWLHQSFADNLPMDRMVAELLQMEGSVARGAPAGFAQATLNDSPMAAKADIIFQAFQAEKLACARCHDAPFHPYTQKDLFSIAAMLQGKPVKLPVASTVPIVEGARKPLVEISLKAGDIIHPQFPFEDRLANSADVDIPGIGGIPTRSELARRILSPANNRFAEVIVNRIWKRYMGVGLVEPVDDWSAAVSSHPELLRYLARELLLSGYDLKHIARLIFSSHAYQRRPVSEMTAQTAPDARLFSGPARRRMTAEQLLDSLHLSAGKHVASEELNLNPSGDRPPTEFLNLGAPERAWEFTALSNERDRPALALPMAQSAVDVLTTYGWRQSRQNPVTNRDDAPSPMQTLILANGNMSARIVRLSDDSQFTELAWKSNSLTALLNETYLRVFSRPPSSEEMRLLRRYLQPAYSGRRLRNVPRNTAALETDKRVSWSNHLSPEATVIRLEEERRLRLGEAPTQRLSARFRERFEDVIWAMFNSPEFLVIP